MLIVFALLAFLIGSPLAAQCTGSAVSANFGGRAGAAAGYADNFATYPETFIDQSRPATAAVNVPEIDFRVNTLTAAPFTVRFIAVNPSGTSYTVRNASSTLSFTPAAAGSQVYAATLSPPLAFQPGDLLGATFYSASGGGLMLSNEAERSGVLIFHSDAPPTAQFPRDSATFSYGGSVIAMEAVLNVSCEQLPPPEVLLPAVGDVVGAAHFTTDVVALFRPRDSLVGPIPVLFTLRDRMGGSPRIATATVNAAIGSQVHPASLSTLLNVTPPYFGSLDISFNAVGGLPTTAMSASANITAATAACGGGGTGSAVEAVSCNRIGREIAIPFHVPDNHRLNIGIVSAQLHSCGIFSPATSVEVWVNSGPHVIVPMPGESTQIGDITGASGAAYGATGVTDGVVYMRVTDEASRIVGYASLLDNTSQDSAVSLGTVLQ